MRSCRWTTDYGTVQFTAAAGDFMLSAITSQVDALSEQSRAPRQHGFTTYFSALNGQTVNLTAFIRIRGTSTYRSGIAFDNTRRWLSGLFAPHREGVLEYDTGAEILSLKCRPRSTPIFGDVVGSSCALSLTFASDSSYWLAVPESVTLGRTLALWSFPWTPTAAGRPLGAYVPERDVYLDGTESASPVVQISASAQVVTLSNLTAGQRVTIEQGIAPGEILIADMDTKTFSVRKEDGTVEDVSNRLSLDSEPWDMLPGVNRLRIDVDDPSVTPVATVIWRRRVLGI